VAIISVVIPTFNRKNKLRRLLKSLENSTFRDFEIIVIDDASSDGTNEMMDQEFPSVKYIRHNKIELVGKSRNDGIMNSTTDYVFMIDDDNVVDPYTLESLYDYIKHGDEFGVIAPVTCFFDRPEIIMYAGSKYSPKTGKTIFLHSGENKATLKNMTYEADGFANCYLFKRNIAIEAGLTDPRIPFAGEDGFLQYKIKLLGHRLICIGNSYVYHDAPESKMFIRATPFRLYFFMRGKITFEKLLFSGTRLFLFSLFLPAYYLWYSYTALKGKDKLSCLKAVALGLKDGLFNFYPIRFES
jgi:glycosyltransferase involved in cell wall biosynthesis